MTDQSRNSLEEKLKTAARTVEPKKEFSEALWHQLSQKQDKNNILLSRQRKNIQWLRFSTAALILIALTVAAIGPQKVVKAFASLIGYLPGSGFVENDTSTLYLSEPVSVEQDGITLTVEQVVADSQNVVVTYEFKNLPQGDSTCIYDNNELQLPDGKVRLPIDGGISGTQAHIYYQSLPVGVTNFTLMVSQNSENSSCTTPKSWNVDLKLGALPAGSTLAPVVNGQELQVSAQLPAPSEGADPAQVDEVSFSVDNVAETTDTYVIAGHVTGSDPTWRDVSVDFSSIKVWDANGTEITVLPDDEQSSNGAFSFAISKQSYAVPLTIQFQKVFISAGFDNQDAFTFDAGAQPELGQTWKVNQSFVLLGHPVTIESISAAHDDSASTDPRMVTGYSILLRTDSEINGLDFRCAQTGGFYGSTLQNPDGSQTIQLTYPDGLPTGKINYQVVNMQYTLNGGWKLQMQLPQSAR
jgi:hypothetical protein